MSTPGDEMPRLDLLRPDLLDDVSILVVTLSGEGGGDSNGSDGRAVFETCSELGADVKVLWAGSGSLALTDAPVDRDELAGSAALPADSDMPDPVAETDALVLDGHALFAAAGLDGCLDGAWQATQAVVNRAFLNTTDGELAGGRIVYLAPRPGAGPEADAARAGLENLARTLSIEWARHGITVVTIALGEATPPGEAAALAAYLASPAGAYFSGCQLDMRGP